MTVVSPDGRRMESPPPVSRAPFRKPPRPTLRDLYRKLKGDRKAVIYFLSFVFVLGILIFVHEFGHFVTAKRFNVAVRKFSIGFGPKIYGFTKGETQYMVSAIPLGGYVDLLGQKPDEQVPPEMEHRTFRAQKPLVKFLVAFAGPGFNAAFAVLAFWIAFVAGAPMVSSKVGAVVPDMPAARANIAPGDTIVRIAGKDVSTWMEVTRAVRALPPGESVFVEIDRDGKRYGAWVASQSGDTVTMLGERVKGTLIGISPAGEAGVLRLSPLAAVPEAFRQCWDMVVLVVKAVWMLIARTLPMEALGGPVKIALVAGTAAKVGVVSLVTLLAALSINLGVVNLLPIPVLDGGHIVFSLVEALRGKPVGPRTYSFVNWIGVVFVVTLTVTVVYNDLVSLVKDRGAPPPAASGQGKQGR